VIGSRSLLVRFCPVERYRVLARFLGIWIKDSQEVPPYFP
jgi:hypothetical protein